MKKTITTRHTLAAPAGNVWATISKAMGVDEWLPVITACEVDGNKRVCHTEQGDMQETILKIDQADRVFRYAIDSQPLLPIENAVGTMRVSDNGGQTELEWTLEFTLQDESLFGMIKQAVEGMYAAGADGLQKSAR